MDRITIFQNNNPNIGLKTRTSTQGEEYELVKQFIDYYCNQFLRDNKTYNLAVFIEPKIMSGFPDVVFASYLPSILDNWSFIRSSLVINDLKILLHLILLNGCNGVEIISALKMQENQVIQSLEKLLDSKLIFRKNGIWKPREMKNIYSIRKLVSIEAKINKMSQVVKQSFINTWFSSHSYGLTNISNPQSETIQGFSDHGIGLYCKGKSFKKIIEAEKHTLPSSYTSLQFNEWIGNSLIH